jgi:hypothetical protein
MAQRQTRSRPHLNGRLNEASWIRYSFLCRRRDCLAIELFDARRRRLRGPAGGLTAQPFECTAGFRLCGLKATPPRSLHTIGKKQFDRAGNTANIQIAFM